jgi:hypothetical protein
MEDKMPKIESISIMRGMDIPEEIRLDQGISKEEFVELRVERINPAETKVIGLKNETPGRKFRKLLKEADITF